jgi:serine/threonine protein kinase
MMTDIEQIVKFFLHIFQRQFDVSEQMEGSAEFRLILSDSHSAQIYELRVKQLSEWKTRRMSIRRIGDSVVSKSTCYVVTYDDLLVIKIPSYPLADFNTYLENIHIELEVAKRLSPRVYCLVPTISAICQKVPDLASRIPENIPGIERAYVDLLIKEPRYQSYLKIGDRFAFFMNLSKHPFFNQVIERIHGDKKWLQEEMFKNSSAFQSSEAFQTVYGIQAAHLYKQTHEIIKDFSRKVDAMATLYGNESIIPDYQKQEWMFAALANKTIHLEPGEITSECCEDIPHLLSAMIQENKQWADEFRKTVSIHIRQKNFQKNRTRIEALVVKILELIYRLKESRIAIRDLKPDNILVMGAMGDVYAYLTDPNKYDLGLIDLETAIDFHHGKPGDIRQPMLAGTSVYMTPSHIFKNKVLMDVFGKGFPRVFYMQDWYSAIGMIHDVIIGRWLFKNTSRLIPEISRARKKSIKNGTPMKEVFSSMSRTFWKSAEKELSTAIEKNREKFQLIQLMLPEHIADMFKEELENEKLMLKGLIRQYALEFFPKNAQNLMAAPFEEIKLQRKKLEKEANDTQPSSDIHPPVVEMLKRIETLKLNLKKSKGCEAIIQKPISGEDLLKFMFQRVCNAMNPMPRMKLFTQP